MSRRSSTRRDAVRRRRRALLVVAVVALTGGILVGGAGGERGDGTRAGGAAARAEAVHDAAVSSLARARAAVARMSLERQVGELLVISFRGTTAPHYVLRALRDHRAAGVILFGGNAPTAAGVRAMTAQLQRAAGGTAIVCLDQEGGPIRVLAFAPSAVGQARQRTPAAARSAAVATAAALRTAGVNVTLGPVADVAAGTAGSFMAGRAYPGDPAAVAASVLAAVRAYEAAGIAPVLKHFPGLGRATTNTDDAPAAVSRSAAQLSVDLEPYRVALAPSAPSGGASTGAPAAVPLVMVAHARYPALDPHRIASQSRPIVTGLLRGELGFDGVAMTDSLEAEASLAASGRDVGRAGVRALDAGIDLLLSTGPGSFLPLRSAVIAQARRSPAFRARAAEAAARVLVLRRSLRD